MPRQRAMKYVEMAVFLVRRSLFILKMRLIGLDRCVLTGNSKKISVELHLGS